MAPAADSLREALAGTKIQEPIIPVVSNVDVMPHSDPDTIKDILSRQLTGPVQWEKTLVTLKVRLQWEKTLVTLKVRLQRHWTQLTCRVCTKAAKATVSCAIPRAHGSPLFEPTRLVAKPARPTAPCFFTVVYFPPRSGDEEIALLDLASQEKGLEEGFEVGPGKVIAGIWKRIDKGFNIVNVLA